MERKISLVGGTPTGAPKIERRKETYFLGCWSPAGKLRYVKIGVTGLGNSRRRLKTLQTGNPDRLTLMAVYCGDVERKLHREFKSTRLHKKTEFFKATPKLLRLIEQLRNINEDLKRLDDYHL